VCFNACSRSNLKCVYTHLSSFSGKAKGLTPEQQRRRDRARELLPFQPQGLLDLCVRALEINADDMNRAVDWLISGQADAYVAGGGLDQETEVQMEDPIFSKAKELATIAGKPPQVRD